MRKSVIDLIIVAGLVLSLSPASADISNVRPEAFNSSALQSWLDSTPSGASGPSGIDAYNDQLANAIFEPGIDLAATSTIMLEMAGYAPLNEFGIYEYGTGTMLKLFTGANVVGDTSLVDLDPDNNGIVDSVEAWTGGTHYTATFAGTPWFGFWLDSPDLGGRIFYTEDSLNPGGLAQAFVYDGTAAWGLTGDYIVAFEDLDNSISGNSDRDFTDFVVVASDIDAVAVPEASTLLLFGSGGLSGLLFMARKKGLIKL